MDRKDIHESHVMKDNDWGDDRHCPESCENCSLTHCYLCKTGEGMDDEDLAVKCIGFSYYSAYEITGDDGITRRVKRCKTGWFDKKEKAS